MRPMKGDKPICYPLLWSAMLIVALSCCPGCRDKKEEVAAVPPPEVTALQVKPQDVPVSFEFVAQTQSSHLVSIQARVSGFLEKRLYAEGAMVKAGQVLFQMDEKPFKAQLAQAKAALAKQEAALATARSNLNRIKPLAELNAASLKDLDDAKGQYQSTAAAVEQAKAQVQAEELNLSYTTIASPVSGIAGSASQTEGTYISPQNSQLTTVEVLSPIWVNFSISENEMQRYRSQMAKGLLLPPKDSSYEVEVILVDNTVFPYKGRITFAEPSYDAQTGTFLVRTSVDNPEGLLRPNQYVRARLLGAMRPQSILLPQRAVQQDSKSQFVWVLDPGNTVEKRPVEVGEWYGDQWIIQEGLQAGERVVVDGLLMLRPGMKVAVKNLGATPADAGAVSKTTAEETATAADSR
ncbi:MAG: efflux RND transporter periplasmic adaptor subunit [Thermodesulfobacteriota bacterium]